MIKERNPESEEKINPELFTGKLSNFAPEKSAALEFAAYPFHWTGVFVMLRNEKQLVVKGFTSLKSGP